MNTNAKTKINNTSQASILKKKFDRSIQYKKIVIKKKLKINGTNL